ncbi:transcriptional regulator [Vagococcus bubulae]|uniref:Transcriptional regulator n=2 Tax=Vagococcus bubulae TaxID=1977868 RepID=A0A429ZE28_9ENTE|nr:transcriptional regulator [Vagococcus bubulae]
MIGLNQTEMGEILGISKQGYSNKERGVNKFNDSEKKKFKEYISNFLPNISIDDIFFS